MTLLLLAATAFAASAPAPAQDRALGLDALMERIEPRVRAVDDAIAALEPLFVAYAEGRDPAGLSEREPLRQDLQRKAAVLKELVDEYWKAAEAARVAKGIDFLADTLSGKKADAAGAAAVILEPPAFPKLAMLSHQRALVLLEHEARAFEAAAERGGAERRRLVLGAGGALAAGLLLGWLLAALLRPAPAPAVAGLPARR